MGIVHVRCMLRSMTVRELEGWRAYYELEPSFDQRADWLFAKLEAMVHNSPREKKNQKPVKDFLLKLDIDDKPKKPNWQYQRDMMLMIAKAHNDFVDSGQREA